MSISVDGVVITEAALLSEARLHAEAGSPAQARLEAARALVIKQLLLGEALRRRILPAMSESAAEQEQAIRQLTETVVAVPEVSEAECRAYFEVNRDRFRGPDLFEPSHILFAAPPDSAEARVEALTAAREVLATLQRDPDRFERIAKERSACPSGANGGSLGQITRGETEGSFERPMRSLAVGEIAAEPIETDHGFHILRLDHRAQGEHLPFEAVADRIRLYLRDRAWRKAVHGFIAELAAGADIQGFSL